MGSISGSSDSNPPGRVVRSTGSKKKKSKPTTSSHGSVSKIGVLNDTRKSLPKAKQVLDYSIVPAGSVVRGKKKQDVKFIGQGESLSADTVPSFRLSDNKVSKVRNPLLCDLDPGQSVPLLRVQRVVVSMEPTTIPRIMMKNHEVIELVSMA